MTLSLYEGRKYQKTTVLHVILVLNVCFSVAVLMFWSQLSEYLAQGIQWATQTAMGDRPEFFDYPYILLWLLPILGIAAAWIAEKADKVKLACSLATMPALLLGLIFGWYFLAPLNWH